MTAAAVAFDADGDGDLDILTHPVNGPLTFFRNNAQDANVIAFELEDHVGNRDGIGAVIEIEDDQGHVQRREIQLGGGFMSFDAPGYISGWDRQPQSPVPRFIGPRVTRASWMARWLRDFCTT